MKKITLGIPSSHLEEKGVLDFAQLSTETLLTVSFYWVLFKHIRFLFLNDRIAYIAFSLKIITSITCKVHTVEKHVTYKCIQEICSKIELCTSYLINFMG